MANFDTAPSWINIRALHVFKTFKRVINLELSTHKCCYLDYLSMLMLYGVIGIGRW